MGNLCSSSRDKTSSTTPEWNNTTNSWEDAPNARPVKKTAPSDPFKKPGRTLASATPSQQPRITATIPSRAHTEDMGNQASSPSKSGKTQTPTSAGRTTGTTTTSTPDAQTGSSNADMRAAAARAAEARMKASEGGGGKLQQKLAAEKRATGKPGGVLQDASRETRGQRGADEARDAREWN